MVTCVFPSGHPFPVLSLQLLIPEWRLPLKGLHLVPYSPAPPRPHTSCPPMLFDPWDPVPPSTPVEYKSPGLEVVHFHSPASPVGTFEQAVNFPKPRASCHPSKLIMGWVPTPALPPTACVSLAKALLSEPQQLPVKWRGRHPSTNNRNPS